MIAVSLDDLEFDPGAQHIAEQRLSILLHHFELWSHDDPGWREFATNADIRQLLLHDIRAQLQTTSLRWLQRLHSVAIDLGMDPQIISEIASSCRGRGWFDIPNGVGQPTRPQIADILPKLTAILELHETVSQRAQELFSSGLCRDIQIGRSVAQTFLHLRLQERAATIIQSVLASWHSSGCIGLLARSSYDCFAELMAVHQFIDRNFHDLTKNLRTEIYADVIALKRSICTIHPPLWHLNLLTEPPHTSSRIDYKGRLFPRIRSAFVKAISDLRHCSPEDAVRLLDLYSDRGVEGLIEWRSIELTQAQHQHRLNANLDEVCRGLAAEVKAEIRLHIDHILAAAASLNMPLSLHTLLLDPPSSPRRRRLKRRLNRTRKRQSDVAVTTTQLASAYAERASLNKPEAKFRIHAFITYGPIGLLPPSLWQSSIDADMFEWLKLMKLGHPEGSVRWGDIYTQAAIYSNEYDLPTYSSQLLHSIYNSIDKKRYWHGGKGLVLLKVHQRFPTVITSRPRLNAEWLVRSCRLPIAIVPNTKDAT